MTFLIEHWWHFLLAWALLSIVTAPVVGRLIRG